MLVDFAPVGGVTAVVDLVAAHARAVGTEIVVPVGRPVERVVVINSIWVALQLGVLSDVAA
jgi:hypothetical protein